MPSVRRIMSHVEAEIARGTRRCRRNKQHQIMKGEPCLMIQDMGTPYRKSYCRRCAYEILVQSCDKLRTIRAVLYPDKAPQDKSAKAMAVASEHPQNLESTRQGLDKAQKSA